MTTLIEEVADLFAAAGIEMTKTKELAAGIDTYYLRKDARELASRGNLLDIRDELKESVWEVKKDLAKLDGMMKVLVGLLVGVALAVTGLYLQ